MKTIIWFQYLANEMEIGQKRSKHGLIALLRINLLENGDMRNKFNKIGDFTNDGNSRYSICLELSKHFQ